MEIEKMKPIFGQLKKAEWSKGGSGHETETLGPFLFVVEPMPNDRSTLRVIVTDFHTHTWEALLSSPQLEDMRDGIGIGGSWSDFVEYVIGSLSSEDVKLVMEGHSGSRGASNAKLIAQKAKGMPRISISLAARVDAATNVAMADLSIALYGAFKDIHCSLKIEEQRSSQLAKAVSDEQEKNRILQRQLDTLVYSKKQRFENVNEKTSLPGLSGLPLGVSLDTPAAQNQASARGTARVVPAYRRARVRGALLQDTEDDAQD